MEKEFWFIVGSVEFYGEANLAQVKQHAQEMVDYWSAQQCFPYTIKCQPLGISSDSIANIILEANYQPQVLGVIFWMHTFSPAKSWIKGLKLLQKPMLHLATQFNIAVPWQTIDMNFMNLNQSAHGDREFGFITKRLNKQNKIIAGYWQNTTVQSQIADWMNVVNANSFNSSIRIARFGDNMRNVADTEGDKVEATIQFGWEVDYYGIGDLVELVNQVQTEQIEQLYQKYIQLYHFDIQNNCLDFFQKQVKYQAAIEIALRQFLSKHNYQAFTTNFEDLHGLEQLPGLAVQRLMADGYGFAGEGDWKTAALVYLLKILAKNQKTGFMEDYTYNLVDDDSYIVGAHMLEVDPTLTNDKPHLIVSPLGIGGKSDPARLVFNGSAGKGIVVSILHFANKFKLIINEIEAQSIPQQSPCLPVAKVVWKPLPNFKQSVERWISAGGGHHTVYSLNLNSSQLIELCKLMNLEYELIN